MSDRDYVDRRDKKGKLGKTQITQQFVTILALNRIVFIASSYVTGGAVAVVFVTVELLVTLFVHVI